MVVYYNSDSVEYKRPFFSAAFSEAEYYANGLVYALPALIL